MLAERVEEKLRRRKERSDLRYYVERAWSLVEPGHGFVPGWHLDAICEHLQAVTNLEIQNLLITMPPRHSKSLTVSVFWPTWVWLEHPELRWLFASYDMQLATRDSLKCRNIIQSSWYQGRVGGAWTMAGDSNLKTRFENSATGTRISINVGGHGIGEGGDIRVCDDPHSASHCYSSKMMKVARDWWFEIMTTRVNDPKTTRSVIVQQRLPNGDLAGAILERDKSFVHLNLPMRYEGEKCRTIIGWEDPREEEGELLQPERFDDAYIQHWEEQMGPFMASAQLQQRPVRREGAILDVERFEYYETPPELDTIYQSWDMAFKDHDDSSYVVGQVWGIRKTEHRVEKYLLDQVRQHMGFTASRQAVLGLSKKWPKARIKIIENKANGPAIIDSLKNTIAGFKEIEPRGSKAARAEAVAPQIFAGEVFLPLPENAPWVVAYVEELRNFVDDNSKPNDQVDSTTQFLDFVDNKPKGVAPMAF